MRKSTLSQSVACLRKELEHALPALHRGESVAAIPHAQLASGAPSSASILWQVRAARGLWARVAPALSI